MISSNRVHLYPEHTTLVANISACSLSLSEMCAMWLSVSPGLVAAATSSRWLMLNLDIATRTEITEFTQSLTHLYLHAVTLHLKKTSQNVFFLWRVDTWLRMGRTIWTECAMRRWSLFCAGPPRYQHRPPHIDFTKDRNTSQWIVMYFDTVDGGVVSSPLVKTNEEEEDNLAQLAWHRTSSEKKMAGLIVKLKPTGGAPGLEVSFCHGQAV